MRGNVEFRLQRAMEALRCPDPDLPIRFSDFCLVVDCSKSTAYRRLEKGVYEKPQKMGGTGTLFYRASYVRSLLSDLPQVAPVKEEVL